MTQRHGNDRIGFGILCFTGAMFLFSIADTTAKWLGMAGYRAVQIAFLRYVFGLVPVSVIILVIGLPALKTRRPLLHAVRAVILFCALFNLFSGLRYLPLAEAIAVSFTAPLFVTALSGPLLGEQVGARRWTAVVIGFAGALIMLRPGTAAFQPEMLYILASALCFALSMLLTRRMAATETSISMLTYTTLGAGLFSSPFALVAWQTPALEHLALFALIGCIGGLAAFILIVSFQHAPASAIVPFEYSALIWASLFGWLLWQETPGPLIWLGAGVIVASGLYLMRQESRSSTRT
ncbi:MAG: DMT family transporter [Pseudomonadota bacterium]